LFLAGAAVGRAADAWKVWKDNDTLTAAELNGNFATLDNRLKAVEAPQTRCVRVHLTTTQTTQTVYTRLDFAQDGVEFNPGQEFETATDIFTVKAAGFYTLTCGIAVPTTAAGTYVAAVIRVNGV